MKASRRIEKVALSDVTVMLLGESDTAKKVFARIDGNIAQEANY